MEQDINENIKILEESIIQGKYHLYKKDLKKFVSNVIKAYKELEEENKTLKNVVSEIFNSEDVTDTYIPVSLVEEKILNPMKEENDKAIKGFMKRDIPQCIEDGGIAQELGYFIGKIEELLEKRK